LDLESSNRLFSTGSSPQQPFEYSKKILKFWGTHLNLGSSNRQRSVSSTSSSGSERSMMCVKYLGTGGQRTTLADVLQHVLCKLLGLWIHFGMLVARQECENTQQRAARRNC